jgi:hypothetical protein
MWASYRVHHDTGLAKKYKILLFFLYKKIYFQIVNVVKSFISLKKKPLYYSVTLFLLNCIVIKKNMYNLCYLTLINYNIF